MAGLQLREYQRESLDAIGRFCDAVRAAVGRNALRPVHDAYYSETGRDFIEVPQLPNVPYVCLRVPTGGGKTLIAAHAVGVHRETAGASGPAAMPVGDAFDHDSRPNATRAARPRARLSLGAARSARRTGGSADRGRGAVRESVDAVFQRRHRGDDDSELPHRRRGEPQGLSGQRLPDGPFRQPADMDPRATGRSGERHRRKRPGVAVAGKRNEAARPHHHHGRSPQRPDADFVRFAGAFRPAQRAGTYGDAATGPRPRQ